MSSNNGNSSQFNERRGQAALNCYFGALAAAAECVASICAPVGAPYRSRLLRLARRLAFGSDPDAMEQSKDALQADLEDFAENLASYQRESVEGATRILRVLSGTLNTMADRHAAELLVLRDAVEQMEVAAEVDDPRQIRRLIRQQTTGLRSVTERLEREQRQLRDSLAADARDLASWLDPKEPALAIDPATGCLTRPIVERHLRRNRGIRHPFCLLVIDCSGLPDRGILVDQGMAKVAERLSEQVRPRDVISRWSSHQFLVVFETDRQRSEARSGQIARWLSDRYQVTGDGKEAAVEIRVAIRVIEPQPGESSDSLIGRVDSAPVETHEPAAVVA